MRQSRKFILEGYVNKKTDRLFFRHILEAPNEKMAIELAYCLIGSRHRAKRTEIKLHKVEEMKEP
ncbi:MAG: 50S ribosomal protein L18Ae [Thermoproteota archaeon]